MAPVTGKVTLDGKPIEGAMVNFYMINDLGARPGAGLTNADGEFQMTTWKVSDGGLIGKHRVTISKVMPPTSPGGDEYELFPAEYASVERTKLEAEVTKLGNNRFEFAITSKKGR